MNKTIYRTINGKDFIFYVSSKRNGYGTTERADLFVEFDTGYNGEFTGFYHWTNRPWQVWDGADACKHAANAYKGFLRECLLDEFKRSNSYERMSAKRKEEFAAILANDEEYQTALALLESLSTETQEPPKPAELVDGCYTLCNGFTLVPDTVSPLSVGALLLKDSNNNFVYSFFPNGHEYRHYKDDPSGETMKTINAVRVAFFDESELDESELDAMNVCTVADAANGYAKEYRDELPPIAQAFALVCGF